MLVLPMVEREQGRPKRQVRLYIVKLGPKGVREPQKEMRPQRLSHCHRKGEARFWKGTYGRKRWPSPEALTAASVPGIPAAESKGKRRRKSPNRQVLQCLEGRQKQQGIPGRAGNTQDAEESPREESGCEKSRATHTWLGQAPPHRREGAGGTDGVKWPQGCQEQKAQRGNRNLEVLQTWAGCTGDAPQRRPGSGGLHLGTCQSSWHF